MTMAFEAFITMLKVEDYDAGTEGHDPEHEDDVEDDDDEDEEKDEEDDDDANDANDEHVDVADDDNDSNYDDEVPTTPNMHSTTPMHIQPYYAPYPPPYYPLYPMDYMMTGPINPHTYTDASTMSDPATDTRRNRGGVTEPFPDKMHRMLDGTEREGLTEVVAFFSHGRAFAIHKPRRFVAEVMPRYFRQTRLTSFQRQLNLYGFRRICQGPDNGGYYHELFLKGRPGLCVNMKRTKVKGASKHKRDPETEPNFYAMRPVLGAVPSMQLSPQTAPGYHGYPAYPYFPPYTAAQTGGYAYTPYYYPHWDYGPVHGSLGTPLSTPGGESQGGDDETPTNDDTREGEYEEGGDDDDTDADETARSD